MSTVCIVVASGNAHKIAEIQQMMGRFQVHSFDKVFGYPHSAIEDGVTFAENAMKKISFLPLLPNTIYLADDSGIEVDALGGRPGIHSARYAAPDQVCATLLAELGNHPIRSARFRCVIALRFPDGRAETVDGTVEGHIHDREIGTLGFGYDPVFIPEGGAQTFGEMTPDQKNQLSHRARALSAAAKRIDEMIGGGADFDVN
jgi:XTP/dITP diphosphohydrolase